MEAESIFAKEMNDAQMPPQLPPTLNRQITVIRPRVLSQNKASSVPC